MVTLEDILEHLFEEELTECSDFQSGCERVDDNTVIVPGKLPLDQFNTLMQTQLPEDEFDTIGGFVLHLFGNLPLKGEEYGYNGFTFHIENVSKSRISKNKGNTSGGANLKIYEHLFNSRDYLCLSHSGSSLFRR